MSWNPIEQPIDKVVMAGKLTPGIAEIVGANSPRSWDERGGYGLSGALSVFTGIKLAHFSIRLSLYTIEDWNDWHAFKAIVAKPPYGKRPRAIDISHPILDDVGIRAVGVEDVLGAEQSDAGVWTIEIKCIEFRKPKVALAKPEGATATPVDPVEQKIALKNAEYDALAAQ